MGDRIAVDNESKDWWYEGRSQLHAEDFQLEQKIYKFLNHDLSFIHRTLNNELVLLGENLKDKASTLQKTFPEISKVAETKIIKDKRHRARIDRLASGGKKINR